MSAGLATAFSVIFVALVGAGPTLALTPPETPARILFSNGGRIVSVNSDGSDRTVLTRKGKLSGSNQAGDSFPEVSPSGSQMVFVRIDVRRSGDGVTRLMLARTDGTGPREILAGRPNLALGKPVTWAPGGEKLILVAQKTSRRRSVSSIQTMRPDGTGRETLVTFPAQVYRPPFDHMLEPRVARLSPDGGLLLVEVEDVFRDNARHLEVVDLATGGKRSLGPQTYSGSWSPDGSKIIYVSSRGASDQYCEEFGDNCLDSGDIFTANADGSGKLRITGTEANEDRPAWSPDGQRVVFSSNAVVPRSLAATEVYSMAPDGSCTVALTNGAPGSFSPVWSGHGSSEPTSCDQPAPAVLTEINPSPLKRFGPVIWPGNNVDGRLLTSTGLSFGQGFSYEDCDLNSPVCAAPSTVLSFPICYWSGLMATIIGGPQSKLRSRGGAIVIADPPEGEYRGLTLLSGGSLAVVLSFGSPNQAGNLALVDQMRRLGGPDRPYSRLPHARIPRGDLRNLVRVERAVKRSGSVRSAARRLGYKPRAIRTVLRFGQRVRALGPVGSIRCAERPGRDLFNFD
jgi:Tol biopolymer transport system component